jgi:hypothetical protein
LPVFILLREVSKMKRICSECGKEIKDDTYDFSKDNKGILALCIGCWNKQQGKEIMNTKEVMGNLEALKYCDSLFGNKNEASKLDDAIELIKRGERFEKMWKELYRDFIRNKEERNISGYSYMVDMRNIKQKYFPKPKIRKEIRVEVLAENEEVIDELAKDIENMNGVIFDAGKIRVVATRWEKE